MQYDLEKIGKIIRDERKKHKWTQKKLGAMLNVSGKQISNYENGVLLPPQDMLLKIAALFNCEYGYILGEESYRDRSKLNTAICESVGLTSEAVNALQTATHKGQGQELIERQQAISSFFTSPYFGRFIDCLVEAININKNLESYSEAFYKELSDFYGDKLVGKAVLYSLFRDLVPAAESDSNLQEIISKIKSSEDKSKSQEYAQKVARYELREAFEALIRDIQ